MRVSALTEAMTRRTLAWAGGCLLGAAALAAVYLSWLPDVTELRSSNPMTTQYVRIYVQRMLRTGNKPAVSMRWVPLEEISPNLQKAVLIAEDDRFYRHRGVDWESFEGAIRYNWSKRKFARGASTITQQVARNLFLSPSRSPMRKLKETLIARYLERELGKPRILEIYLNIAEWGEGVFGAEAASQAYFGRHASDLSVEEAVDLAMALPSPYERNPDKPASEQLLKLRELYLERMRRAGYSPEEDAGPGGQEPLEIEYTRTGEKP